MKRFFLILFAVVVCTRLCAADEIADSVFEADPYFLLMGEADAAISREDYREAVARLNDVLRVDNLNPSNALVYCNLGACYSALGEDSLALECYDESLMLAPRMLTTLLAKGRQLLAMNRDYEAYDTFERAIETDSISTDARYYHGMMALYGGNRAIAERDFAVLLDVAPYTTDTARAMSALYSLTGRDELALPYLKTLIEDDPQPEYYAALAGCYLQLERLSDASALLTSAMELYPADPELYYYRAWLYRDQYRLDDARADGRRAVQLGASQAKVDALLGR